jgi:hypothetical protein
MGLHRPAQTQLQPHGEAEDAGHGDAQHPAQRPGDHEGHRDEQQHEGQIGQRAQHRRGEEVAHQLDLPEVMRVGAGALGLVLHAHAQGLAEQARADQQVGLAPGQVDQVAAQLARKQIESQRNEGADGQRPQGGGGGVRNHLVEDHRGHQAGDEQQHVR